ATANWRTGYVRHFREMTRLALLHEGAATAISAAGLAAVHERFRFRRGGEDFPLSSVSDLAVSSGAVHSGRTALRTGQHTALHTVTVTGTRPPGPDVLSVPYRGGRLVAG